MTTFYHTPSSPSKIIADTGRLLHKKSSSILGFFKDSSTSTFRKRNASPEIVRRNTSESANVLHGFSEHIPLNQTSADAELAKSPPFFSKPILDVLPNHDSSGSPVRKLHSGRSSSNTRNYWMDNVVDIDTLAMNYPDMTDPRAISPISPMSIATGSRGSSFAWSFSQHDRDAVCASRLASPFQEDVESVAYTKSLTVLQRNSDLSNDGLPSHDSRDSSTSAASFNPGQQGIYRMNRSFTVNTDCAGINSHSNEVSAVSDQSVTPVELKRFPPRHDSLMDRSHWTSNRDQTAATSMRYSSEVSRLSPHEPSAWINDLKEDLFTTTKVKTGRGWSPQTPTNSMILPDLHLESLKYDNAPPVPTVPDLESLAHRFSELRGQVRYSTLEKISSHVLQAAQTQKRMSSRKSSRSSAEVSKSSRSSRRGNSLLSPTVTESDDATAMLPRSKFAAEKNEICASPVAEDEPADMTALIDDLDLAGTALPTIKSKSNRKADKRISVAIPSSPTIPTDHHHSSDRPQPRNNGFQQISRFSYCSDLTQSDMVDLIENHRLSLIESDRPLDRRISTHDIPFVCRLEGPFDPSQTLF